MASRSEARMRKAFKFTDDNDSDDMPEALDEEEQEHLIADFRAKEAQMNQIYTNLFTVFSLLLIPAYLPPIYWRLGGRGHRIPLLAITSLLCTAWTMHFIPPGRTGIQPLDTFLTNLRDPASENAKAKRPLNPQQILQTEGEGPVFQFLPLLNACLALLILIMGRLAAGSTKGEREDGISKLVVSGLPMLGLVMVMGAKLMLGGVGVDELEGLRYGYKGA